MLCAVSSVIVTIHGICYLVSCIGVYSLDCLTAVSTMLVFLVCGYDEN
jgi:hypothetical protein